MSAFTKRKAVAFAAVAAIPFSLAVSAPAFAATTNVTTWDQLKAAFDAAPLGAVGDPIKLDADIVSEDGERLVVPHSQGNDGAAIVFDLAGHSLDITALAGSEAAAIGVFDGASLLVIDSVGGGELNATGADYGAGIGADATDPDDYGWDLGDVAIEGGTINATGGDYAAGIGNAYYSTGGHVTIRGGDVTATGGYEAAGIGGAYYTGFYDRGYRATASVDILGGTVDASGGRYAAGIGGGYSGSYGAVVNIENATVTATGSEGGSGIGGGFSAEKGAPITITGSTVVATGSTYSSNDGGTPNDSELYGGAGIGEGAGQHQSTDTTVLITDSDVTAVGGTHAAGIGTGSFYDSDQEAVRSLQGVAILNSRVKATGGGGAAGIGGAQGQPGTEVQIGHGSLVTAKGGSSDAAGGGAGIGAGANYSDSPAPGAGTLRLEGAAQLGASTTAGNGSGVDRDEALDSIGGDAATLVGDDSDFVWNAVSVDGQAAGDGGSTDISWVTPVTPAADPTTPALAETGSGAVAPGLAIGGLLMAAGAALVLRRRVRAKA